MLISMRPQASMKPDKVLLTCPKCGHRQPEPPAAYSTVCKKCAQYFRVQDALNPVAKVEEIRAAGRKRLLAEESKWKRMAGAIALYRKVGFELMEPYYGSGCMFLRRGEASDSGKRWSTLS